MSMEEKLERHWYVIHTYSGYENKVKANIERKIKSLDMTDKIFQVQIPTEKVVDDSGDKRRTVERKTFPGYVLVEMIVTDRTWYAVRNTPGVTGFVGSGTKPTPLSEEEVKPILRSMGLLPDEPEPEEPALPFTIDFQLQQAVRLKSGPFHDQVGKIVEINKKKRLRDSKLKVLLDFFGRQTTVEVDVEQVEAVD